VKNYSSHKFLPLFFLFLGITFALSLGHLYAQEPKIIYVYDDLGRLSRVVDQNNECATYEYDAVGNILSITRGMNCLQPPTVDSLSQDTANAGDTTCITIRGTNFLGATVTTDNPDVQISRVRVSATSIEVCLIISQFASLGAARIIVTTMAGVVDVGQDCGKHARVQRLDATAEDLGRARQLAHLDHRDARGPQRLRGAAGGDDLEAELDEAADEAVEAALIGDGDE